MTQQQTLTGGREPFVQGCTVYTSLRPLWPIPYSAMAMVHLRTGELSPQRKVSGRSEIVKEHALGEARRAYPDEIRDVCFRYRVVIWYNAIEIFYPTWQEAFESPFALVQGWQPGRPKRDNLWLLRKFGRPLGVSL